MNTLRCCCSVRNSEHHMAQPLKEKMTCLLGYSRFVQAMLSLSQPAAGALLAAEGFPSLRIILIGIAAAVAGNLSVFSLNDLLDLEVDTRRFSHLKEDPGFDIDSAFMRHPLAQGYLGKTLAVTWTVSLGCIALILAWMLKPLCAVLFMLSLSFEIVYCRLSRVTHWKFLVSGLMVSFGAVAGWVAAADEINWVPLGLFLVWVTGWEIGGRNIVNDWSDVEEDKHLGVKTVPLIYGYRTAGRLTVIFLVIGVAASLAIAPFAGLDAVYIAGCAAAGLAFLIIPALTLTKTLSPESALALFNKASLYPPAMLAIIVAGYYYQLVF